MVFKAKKDDKKRNEPITYPTYPSYTTKAAEEASPLSFIGETMEIEGDITSDEDITVQGKVKGNIIVSTTLTIGKSGKVQADIKASIVRIIGEAWGNIIASDKVEILSQGRYTGNIQSQKLVVSDGAILNGNINQDAKNPKSKK
jgi:cytoskeletal protein CcmA (bactofilin family)